MKHVFRKLGCALSLTVLAISPVAAQTYPDRPVRIIVPYAAGGGTDLVYRILSASLSEILGQQFVVENKPGGASTIGLDYVAKSKPDGYTLGVGNSAFGANPSIIKKMPFDSEKDLVPVSLVSKLPLVLVVNPAIPARSVKELIALAKAAPGTLNYSSAGNASGNHLAAELFAYMTGTKMMHIPYKGGSPAVQSTLSGDTGILFASIPTAIQYFPSGKLIPLGVSSLQRTSTLPDVPTIAEIALPGFEAVEWNGVFVPAGTPQSIVQTLNQAIVKALASPAVREKMSTLGADPVGSSPQEFATFIKKELTTWSKVVKEAGITSD